MPDVARRHSVAAVIVTRNRRDVLRRTIHAVLAQTFTVAEIHVVDNDSADGTRDMVASEFPNIRYLRLSDNAGYPAGLHAGMQQCVEHHDFVWLFDDDSQPRPAALERLLRVMTRDQRTGIVGLGGGILRWGVPCHHKYRRPFSPEAEPGASICDFVLVDGALVSCAAARAVGLPRADFFFMLEDVEYSTRLARHGWQVAVLDAGLVERGHLGTGPPWRAYYQSRNHLVLALEHRSTREVCGWVFRQAKHIFATPFLRDRRLQRVWLRGRGGWDAVLGRMGRQVEPRA